MNKIFKIILIISISLLLIIGTAVLFCWLFEPPITYIFSAIFGIALGYIAMIIAERVLKQ